MAITFVSPDTPRWGRVTTAEAEGKMVRKCTRRIIPPREKKKKRKKNKAGGRFSATLDIFAHLVINPLRPMSLDGVRPSGEGENVLTLCLVKYDQRIAAATQPQTGMGANPSPEHVQ
jgi:hypothetical protein